MTDLVHLLAELLENATTFSSPQTKVRVTATRLPDGRVMIEIHDKGIGLTAEDFADINHKLANPPTVDAAISQRMGLFVVGRLADRHGIRVQLRPSGEQAGTTSLVMLPDAITHGGGGEEQRPRTSSRSRGSSRSSQHAPCEHQQRRRHAHRRRAGLRRQPLRRGPGRPPRAGPGGPLADARGAPGGPGGPGAAGEQDGRSPSDGDDAGSRYDRDAARAAVAYDAAGRVPGLRAVRRAADVRRQPQQTALRATPVDSGYPEPPTPEPATRSPPASSRSARRTPAFEQRRTRTTGRSRTATRTCYAVRVRHRNRNPRGRSRGCAGPRRLRPSGTPLRATPTR